MSDAVRSSRVFAKRYHDISTGHRVVGHEGKCVGLHGHNYRITFVAETLELDEVGRVVDFGVLKSTMCMWVENNWDHRLLLWEKDPMVSTFKRLGSWMRNAFDLHHVTSEEMLALGQSIGAIREVPFNPTAENMALYLLNEVAPNMPELTAGGVRIVRVDVEETRKCSAIASIDD